MPANSPPNAPPRAAISPCADAFAMRRLCRKTACAGFAAIGLASGVASLAARLAPGGMWRLGLLDFAPSAAVTCWIVCLASIMGWACWRGFANRATIATIAGILVAGAALLLAGGIHAQASVGIATAHRFRERLALFQSENALPLGIGVYPQASAVVSELFDDANIQILDRTDIVLAPRQLPRVILDVRHPANPSDAPSLDIPGYRRVFAGIVSGDEIAVHARLEPLPDTAIRLAFIGDSGKLGDELNGNIRQMLAAHATAPLDAVLLLGDNVYGDGPPGALVERHMAEPFGPLLAQGIPHYAILGNHDYGHGFATAEMEDPRFGMHGRNYYRVRFGGGLVRLLCLDSETILDDSLQLAWLRDEMQWTDAQWTVATLHRPLEATQGAGHGPDPRRRALLDPLLEGPDGADLIVAGHNHIYERLRDDGRTMEIVAGAGSKLDRDRLSTNPDRVMSEKEQCSFGIVTFTPGSAEACIRASNGNVIDSFPLPRSQGLSPIPNGE